jgi:transposase
MKNLRYVGLDVHAETISVAVAEQGRNGEVRSLGSIPNRPESVRKLLKKLGSVDQFQACYEAGPTGYVLYWQLAEMGVKCEVIAPTLIPVKAGDRVKTDRMDAQKLARCYRAGELTAVWVPDAAHEALRDLVRARLAAIRDQLRMRNRLSKFLLRHGRRPPSKMSAWTTGYMNWVKKGVHFDQPAQEATLADYLHEVEHVQDRIGRLEKAIDDSIATMPEKMRAVVDALQSLRGIAKISAVTIVAELGEISRFDTPKQLMGYSGAVSSEHSSGERTRRGGITKTGNAHLRRIAVESAWAYRHRPCIGASLKARQKTASQEVRDIAWKAQHRLHQRYIKLMARGKVKQKVVTAVARELLGFIWAIAVETEKNHNSSQKKQAA